MNNAKGALILSDNLLVNVNQKSIINNHNVDDIKFEHLEKIIKVENNLEAITNKYLKYIASLRVKIRP